MPKASKRKDESESEEEEVSTYNKEEPSNSNHTRPVVRKATHKKKRSLCWRRAG